MNLNEEYVGDNCITFHISVCLEYFTRKESAEYYM